MSVKDKRSARILFFLIAVLLPLYAVKVYLKEDYTDFSVYYRTAVRMKNLQWDQIYTLNDGASPFRYIPPLLPLFRPFAELGPVAARMVWYFFQWIGFGFGFFWIYRSMQLCRKKHSALAVTTLSLLFILRFCLDTFTIGQVSSWMFFGFCMGLYGWMIGKPWLAVSGIGIPTIFKVGPGFLYGLFLGARFQDFKKAMRFGLIGCASLGLSSFLVFRQELKNLWISWANIVANDSVYYDASHYGSQSWKSVLLRAMKAGWLQPEQVNWIYQFSILTVCSALVLFWTLRRPKSFYGRGLFYCLGLFAYMWLMPETFKYSLTPLAIPVAFLFIAPKKDLFLKFSLGFSILTLSLAGKDLVGDRLFFGAQQYSVPFLATIFLAISVLRLAWRESLVSSKFQSLWKGFQVARTPQIGPWETPPQQTRDLEISVLIPIPLESSVFLDIHRIELTLKTLTQTLRNLGSSEILLIPFGNRVSEFHPLLVRLKSLGLSYLPHSGPSGRGAALRTGFLKSRGRKIFVSQIEQPCDSRFFAEASTLLNSGVELVRANRRLEGSQFHIPVRLLSLVYGRHRMGLWFNRMIRIFLPVHTTDTQSSTFAFSSEFAVHAFALQTAADFLFDLEINLVAISQKRKERDLPVTVWLAEEKTSLRILQEVLSIFWRLPLFIARFHKGYYGLQPKPTAITADDWGLSAGVNQGILNLAKLGVVRRVSLMANCPYLESGLNELCQIPGIELGLHFNLTYARPMHPGILSGSPLLNPQNRFLPSPAKVLLRWLNPFQNKKLYREQIRLECLAQLDKLQSLGVKIQYLDGHHHIHLVPGLMDVLADVLRERKIQQVRLPYDPALWFTAQAPIVFLARLAKSKWKKYGFRFLPVIYPQKSYFQDQGKLRAKLLKHPEAEVIVHPAETNDLGGLEFPDSYTQGRVLEFQALRMLRF